MTKALAGRGSKEICEEIYAQMRHVGGTFDVAIVMYFMNDCITKRGAEFVCEGASIEVSAQFDQLCRALLEATDRPFMIIGGSAATWHDAITGTYYDAQVEQFCAHASRAYGIPCTTGAKLFSGRPMRGCFHLTKAEENQAFVQELNANIVEFLFLTRPLPAYRSALSRLVDERPVPPCLFTPMHRALGGQPGVALS